MNDLLYLVSPLGCVATVAIAAVLVTRAGGRRRMAGKDGHPPPTRQRVQPGPSRGQRNRWWPVPGAIAVAAGSRGDSADVWARGDGGSRRARP